jgi:hypothetical protein
MSRRIIFAALAASAALIATQAIADRECFEDSCRVPEAAEPPAAAAAAKSEEPVVEPQAAQAKAELQAAQAQAQAEPQPSAPQAAAQANEVPEPVPPGVTVTVIPEPARPAVPPAAEARADSRLAPASVLPKVVTEPAPPKLVAEPAPRQTPPQASTRAEEARMRREPARVAPSTAPSTAETRKSAPAAAPVAAALAPARSVNVAVPTYVRPERPPQQAYVPSAAPTPPAGYVVRERPSVATAAVVEVPGEIQTGDGLVTVYPNLRHDPAWKLCQIDSRDLGRRSYRCTAYSYHPYGEGGYRPFGVYRYYPAAPGYVVAPNAKIISIETND